MGLMVEKGASAQMGLVLGEIKRNKEAVHLLEQIKLPSRYESLISDVGADIAQLLVEPSSDTLDKLRLAALHIRATRRGLFLPIFANSGTGKTTLVSSLSTWIADRYGPTVRLDGGEITANRMREAAAQMVDKARLTLDDQRILVMNVDDRESDPPSDKELAQIKAFLRESGERERGIGSRVLVVWPETDERKSHQMAKAYEKTAGPSPIDIPVRVEGPPRETWPQLARNTLKLVNDIDGLEELGVDPERYNSESYSSIGDYLEAISGRFVTVLHDLLKSLQTPLRLVIAFVSESNKAGILSELTGNRYGLLSAAKLMAATPNSEVGKWWSRRTNLLIKTILVLDARAVCIAPSLTVSIIHRYGPDEVCEVLNESNLRKQSMSQIARCFDRSDFGKLLKGASAAAAEGRGNPGKASEEFRRVAERVGFTSGKDKELNLAFGRYLQDNEGVSGEVKVETKIEAGRLIPDISLRSENYVTCMEFHWRSKNLLVSANRSEVARYILSKLRSYAKDVGWTSD